MTESNDNPRYSLLTQSLIRTESRDGSGQLRSLPGVMAALNNGEDITSFPGLQPHQWHGWHTFLVQLAALATADDSVDTPTTETGWCSAIRNMTPDYSLDEPWCLVVSDLSQPAFLQPPVPEDTLSQFEGPYETPDASALDILITATDHDVKVERQTQAQAEHWLFSLVSYQTLSGFSGKNNYGVIRMNGGYATRPVVGLAWRPEWSDLFRRDLAVLREHHEKAKRAKELTSTGWQLLWLLPWDGRNSLAWADCDPYAIELSRRVRLTEKDGKLRAWRRSTAAPRLSPKSDVLKGNVGDPWIPVSIEGKATNIGANGWDYDRVRRILLEDGYAWPPTLYRRGDDPQELWFYAAGLARGQGKTEGFHERWVPIPAFVVSRIFATASRRELGEVAQERVKRAGEARKVLHRALVVLLASAPASPDFRDNSDQRWLNRFETHVDTVFFDELWADSASMRKEQRRRWDRTLRQIVEEHIWPEAEAEAPVADARRERAQARAWMVLRGGLKKTISLAYANEEEAHAVS